LGVAHHRRSLAHGRFGDVGKFPRDAPHRGLGLIALLLATQSEGRINHLKRSSGWNRTDVTGINGARTWCGHGVFAHNLVKISVLAA
jgi:transposase, IS5 family